MSTRVNIDGRITRPEDALISVFDRGFLFGDSVYETVRTYGGRPFLMDRHLKRLARSAGRIEIAIPGGVARIEAEIQKTLDDASNAESYVRIVVTRGSRPGIVDLDIASAGDPTLVLIVRPHRGFDPACYAKGVSIAVVSVRRTGSDALDPAVKSGNYLNNILALREARSRGAFECLMLNREGHLTECSTSNVFLVADGLLRTPALSCGLLDGITRTFVMEVARGLGIETREEALRVSDLRAADEVFLTSSLKEVMPVTSVDGNPVGRGVPGPVTRELLRAYREAAWRSVGLEPPA